MLMNRLALAALLLPFIVTACNEVAPADNRTASLGPTFGKADQGDYWYDDWEDERFAQVDEPSVEDSDESETFGTYQLALDLPDSCQSPCTLQAELTPSSTLTRIEFEADGWYLGHAFGSPAFMVYDFTQAGLRSIKASAYEGDILVAVATKTMYVELPKSSCGEYDSLTPENAPVQIAGEGAPDGAHALNWLSPAQAVFYAPFSGTPGQTALHEGIDYIHGDDAAPYIPVVAASDGIVVYVRSGCGQSSMFSSNAENRECGSGWGNHVVLDHGNGIHTRYAHFAPGTLEVSVGQQVIAGDLLGEMGNSGRSETRHLHFELGVSNQGFDPCAPAQSLDTVHNPESVGL